MALKYIGTIQRWECLSTDGKPTGTIREGSTLAELDTGRNFVFTTDGGWIEDLASNLTTGKAIQLNSELRYLAEKTYLEVKAANTANGIEVA